MIWLVSSDYGTFQDTSNDCVIGRVCLRLVWNMSSTRLAGLDIGYQRHPTVAFEITMVNIVVH